MAIEPRTIPWSYYKTKKSKTEQSQPVMDWTDEAVGILIHEYEVRDALYNRDHPKYSIQCFRRGLLKEIREEIVSRTEGYEKLTLDDVRKKLKLIRIRYREESAKLIASDYKYMPRIWWFERLHFLRPHMALTSSEPLFRPRKREAVLIQKSNSFVITTDPPPDTVGRRQLNLQSSSSSLKAKEDEKEASVTMKCSVALERIKLSELDEPKNEDIKPKIWTVPIQQLKDPLKSKPPNGITQPPSLRPLLPKTPENMAKQANRTFTSTLTKLIKTPFQSGGPTLENVNQFVKKPLGQSALVYIGKPDNISGHGPRPQQNFQKPGYQKIPLHLYVGANGSNFKKQDDIISPDLNNRTVIAESLRNGNCELPALIWKKNNISQSLQNGYTVKQKNVPSILSRARVQPFRKNIPQSLLKNLSVPEKSKEDFIRSFQLPEETSVTLTKNTTLKVPKIEPGIPFTTTLTVGRLSDLNRYHQVAAKDAKVSINVETSMGPSAPKILRIIPSSEMVELGIPELNITIPREIIKPPVVNGIDNRIRKSPLNPEVISLSDDDDDDESTVTFYADDFLSSPSSSPEPEMDEESNCLNTEVDLGIFTDSPDDSYVKVEKEQKYTQLTARPQPWANRKRPAYLPRPPKLDIIQPLKIYERKIIKSNRPLSPNLGDSMLTTLKQLKNSSDCPDRNNFCRFVARELRFLRKSSQSRAMEEITDLVEKYYQLSLKFPDCDDIQNFDDYHPGYYYSF